MLSTASLVDIVIVVVIASAGISGWRSGGAVSAVRLVALLVGLVIGLRIAGLLSTSLSPVAHLVLGVACALGGLLIGGALGSRLGVTVSGGLARIHLGLVDRAVGALVRGFAAAVLIWMVLVLVVTLGPSRWADTIRSARAQVGTGSDSVADVPVVAGLVEGITRTVQAAAPDDLAALVPDSSSSAPSHQVIARIDSKVADSVFLVSATGCKGVVVGTGFVAGHGLFVTNAHVVRGAHNPRIRTDAGDLAATTLVYDRRADLAVLRVANLNAPTLPIATQDARNGTPAVVVGYPGGGPRTAVGAVISQRLPFPDPGFSDGPALHQTYRLDAAIRPGNSGSPLLDTQGQVLGVVNASSSTPRSQGFAITDGELEPDLTAAATRTHATSTGGCT